MLPDRESKDLATRILAERPEVWLSLETELANLFRELFSNEELEELADFLASETGRKWIDYTPQIYSSFQVNASDPESSTYQFTLIGCVVGVLGTNLQALKQSVGETEPGVSEELYEAVRPSVEAAGRTCDCLFRRGFEKWPERTVMQLQADPAYHQFARELLTSGECPLPVPEIAESPTESPE